MKPMLAVTTLALWAGSTVSELSNDQLRPDGFEGYRLVEVDGALSFGASVAGDFTGDGRTDVVVIVDGAPVLLFGPDAYLGPTNGALAVPVLEPGGTAENVWDLALFENVGPDDVDALFTVGENGLVRWRFLQGVWERTVIGGGWVPANADLSAVATWEYEGSGVTWVGVLEDDGVTVHVLTFLSSSGGFFGQVTPFTLPTSPITSFDIANLDADGQPEILAVSADGVDVWKLDTQNTISILTATFAVVLDEPGPVERVAFISESGGHAFVHTLNGLPEPDPIDLGSVAVHAIAAGDRDGNGWDDLLVSTDGADRFVVFRNKRGDKAPATTLTADDSVALFGLLEATLFTPPPVTSVLFADLEDDRDDDVLLWNGAPGSALTFRAETIAASDHEPEGYIHVGPASIAETFPFNVIVTGAAGPIPPDVTLVEAIAWFVDPSGTTPISPDGVAVHDVELRGWPATLQMELPLPEVDGFYYWSVELRLVAGADGEARHAYPSRLNSLQLEVEYLPPPPGERGERGGRGTDGTKKADLPELRGQFLPLTDIPPFGQGEVPIVPILR
jgi:hypothetical protein